MIDRERNPIEWALMLTDLEEVGEHIQSLMEEMHANGTIDDEDFRVRIFHMISHLNRAWNGRNHIGESLDEDRDELSQVPKDFFPVG